MIQISPLDLFFGAITIISLWITTIQIYKRKQTQNHAIAIYSQLWDIIVEIDKGKAGITSIDEIKRLINQVRIEVIALNRNLSSDVHIIKPWDFQSKRKFKESINWEAEKIKLRQQLEDTKKEQKGIEETLDKLEKVK